MIDSYVGTMKGKEYGKESGYIKEAMAFIRNEYANGIGVNELAQHLNVSRSYLYTLFMKGLNISPRDFCRSTGLPERGSCWF